MILSPQRLSTLPVHASRHVPQRRFGRAGAGLAAPRRPGQGLADTALAGGSGLAALDHVVRNEAKRASAWRHRLALAAATASARQMGRSEDEAALRDALFLTRPGDDAGPAGRMLLAWRCRIATRPAEELLTEQSLTAVLQAFGYPDDGEAARSGR